MVSEYFSFMTPPAPPLHPNTHKLVTPNHPSPAPDPTYLHIRTPFSKILFLAVNHHCLVKKNISWIEWEVSSPFGLLVRPSTFWNLRWQSTHHLLGLCIGHQVYLSKIESNHTSISSTTKVYGRESWQSRTRRSPWRATSLGTGTTTFFSWSLEWILSPGKSYNS